MSEGNPDVTSEPQGQEEQSSEPGYYYAEGVAGQGEAPEWFLKDKYKSVSDQAKGYSDLRNEFNKKMEQFKGVSGAPEQYEISAPEGFEIAEDDPVLVRAQEWAKDNGLPQDTFNGLIGVYAELEQARAQAAEDYFQEQVSQIENYESRSSNIGKFLTANGMESLAGMITTKDQMDQFEKLLGMAGSMNLDAEGESVAVPTEEEIRKLMFEKDEFGRTIYNYDKERQKQVRGMWEAREGKNPYRKQVG